MTQAISSQGTRLLWNDQPIAEITSISGPTESFDLIDVTSLESTGGFKEFIVGLGDGGEISFEGNFIASDIDGQIAMYADFKAREKRNWRIEMPDGSSLSGEGLLTAWSLNFPANDKISISGKIKVSGSAEFIPAES